MASNGQKGRKLGRMKDWCKQYTAKGCEEINRKKKRLRHLKANPTDAAALESYTKDHGTPTGLKPNAKGRKVLKRAKAAERKTVAA